MACSSKLAITASAMTAALKSLVGRQASQTPEFLLNRTFRRSDPRAGAHFAARSGLLAVTQLNLSVARHSDASLLLSIDESDRPGVRKGR
jgi:hypothetical protein